VARSYAELLDAFLAHLLNGGVRPTVQVVSLAHRLGALHATGGDVVALHGRALEEAGASRDDDRLAGVSAVEGRLLVVEALGGLIDWYRALVSERPGQSGS
jgi:hypothetical protein